MLPLPLFITVTLATALFMEWVAWASHKYLMHGPLWFLHKSHHLATLNKNKIIKDVVSSSGFHWELNDVFGFIGAAISIVFIIVGIHYVPILLPIGLGMTVYGFIYFMIHDFLTHKRISHSFIPKNQYLRRVLKAHRIHHSSPDKENGRYFGFVFIPKIESR